MQFKGNRARNFKSVERVARSSLNCTPLSPNIITNAEFIDREISLHSLDSGNAENGRLRGV